jgi:glucosamine--fructose-6-phosphate aminotransferase (isomerizing)
VCGIVGYIGFREAPFVLINCLKHLDYRGYDSAGIGLIGDKLHVYKEVGEIPNLEKKVPHSKETLGIAHTRWATHGKVSKENAHPQVCNNNKIAVVHNGIIENFKTLREDLQKKGHTFASQTDTEVIVHLIDDAYQGNLEDAVLCALKKLKGSYALVVVHEDEPDKLIGARKESPLIIGIGDNENFLASDIPAVLNYTNRVVYVDDGEICSVTATDFSIYDESKHQIEKKETIITWDIKDAEKAGFPHFMLKEIYEQPDSIHQTMQGRVFEREQSIEFPDRVEHLLNTDFDSIYIVACGTSYYAGWIGKYLIEQLTGIPVIMELASEFRYFGVKRGSSLVIGISQSGETADTLAALREGKKAGCQTLVISNVIGSTATRITDGFLLTQSGLEVGVAATKTFTSQILILYLIALKLAMMNNRIFSDQLYKHILALKALPRQLRQVLDQREDIEEIAKHIKETNSIFYIGRGMNYPLALEGALKLKEISYIHAEGFAAGELKHGPFALLTKNTPVIAITTKDAAYEKVLANIGEVQARGPEVIAIAEDEDQEILKHADLALRFPSGGGLLSCIPIAVILQLLAYHVAHMKGCSIDKPRNLAKSVTVE